MLQEKEDQKNIKANKVKLEEELILQEGMESVVVLILGSMNERNGVVVVIRVGIEVILYRSRSLMESGTCIARRIDVLDWHSH